MLLHGLVFKGLRFVYAFTTVLFLSRLYNLFLTRFSHSCTLLACFTWELYADRYIHTDFTQCDTGIGALLDTE